MPMDIVNPVIPLPEDTALQVLTLLLPARVRAVMHTLPALRVMFLPKIDSISLNWVQNRHEDFIRQMRYQHI
jgi:hypothetical protein